MEPNSSQASGTSVTTVHQSSGAFVRMLYVQRELKGYAVTASELRQIGSLNRMATLFFSVGAGAVGYALGIWWDVATTPADPTVQTVGNAMLKLCIGAAILSFGVGVYFAYTRRSEVAQILSESKSSER